MGRVASLLRGWATSLGKRRSEVDRWASLGFLHDMLRDADPEALRPEVPEVFRSLDGNILHGPAAARRLEVEGINDRPLLDAVTYHTLGYEGFKRIGRALYAADFLEPGRSFGRKWRAGLRSRMPDDMDRVVREILAARIERLIERSRPIRPETVAFWNRMVRGKTWADAP